jgi:predicted transcriptional regulator
MMSFPDPLSSDGTPAFSDEPHAASAVQSSGRLGKREREVLEIVWAAGDATVGQVSRRLSLPLAYTTVMTTLDRLFKKGLLHRIKQDRAFLYSPALSPSAVESLRARALLDRFFNDSRSSPDVLLSCLIDVIGSYDDTLLRSLEDKVKAAKLQLETQRSTQDKVERRG